MAQKLSKPATKAHLKAMDLVESDRTLKHEERLFILENFQEAYGEANSLSGAFFTPLDLARDLSIEVDGRRIVDLCAGIGMLAFACSDEHQEVLCVERNPSYVKAGRRVLPQAEWIQADVFDLDPRRYGRFDCAISNPPFGRIKAEGDKGRFTGPEFEYRLIDVASHWARRGVFLIPQASAPFRMSGVQRFVHQRTGAYERFQRDTGLELTHSCGIDTAQYRGQWRGVQPVCEVVLCDFGGVAADGTASTEQLDLFAAAP